MSMRALLLRWWPVLLLAVVACGGRPFDDWFLEPGAVVQGATLTLLPGAAAYSPQWDAQQLQSYCISVTVDGPVRIGFQWLDRLGWISHAMDYNRPATFRSFAPHDGPARGFIMSMHPALLTVTAVGIEAGCLPVTSETNINSDAI